MNRQEVWVAFALLWLELFCGTRNIPNELNTNVSDHPRFLDIGKIHHPRTPKRTLAESICL